MRPRRWRMASAAAVGLMLLIAGCGSGHRSSATGKAATDPGTAAAPSPAAQVTGLTTVFIAQAGTRVLADNQHEALYMFVPDHQKEVTCDGLCAASWPPVYSRAGHLRLSGGVRAGLLGSLPDPTGGRVVAYNGWPLYRYADDTQPGYAAGQGVNLDGGYWYLLLPDGRPLVPKGLPKA